MRLAFKYNGLAYGLYSLLCQDLFALAERKHTSIRDPITTLFSFQFSTSLDPSIDDNTLGSTIIYITQHQFPREYLMQRAAASKYTQTTGVSEKLATQALLLLGGVNKVVFLKNKIYKTFFN